MKRAFAMLLVCSGAARAGDAEAHRHAGMNAAVQLQPEFPQGVGAPVVNCSPQQGRFTIDTSLDRADIVNQPDVWYCNDGPPKLVERNAQLMGTFWIPPTAYKALDPFPSCKLAMACNYTHFASNPAFVGLNADDAEKLTLDWAHEILDGIDAAPGGEWRCNTEGWTTYWNRVLAALHYAQDMEAEQHREGNSVCSPSETVPTQVGMVPTFASRNLCWGFVNQAMIDAGTGALKCDNDVVGLSFAEAMRVLCRVGLSPACMGLERLIKHHCKYGAGRVVDCAGTEANHCAGQNPYYCEGELCPGQSSSGAQDDFLTRATDVSVRVMELMADNWKARCKEPDVPCDPVQCDTWCRHSTFSTPVGSCDATGGACACKCLGPGETPRHDCGPFTLQTTTIGQGTVGESAPPPPNVCGAPPPQLPQGEYSAGTVVQLTASPATNWTFGYWSGACSGSGPCSVTMNSDQSVIATFLITYWDLAISKSGTGVGNVGANPSGPSYANGSSVQLIATAFSGSHFVGWSGDCASYGSQPICTLLMNGNKSVGAQFDLASSYSITWSPAGTGSGNVGADKAGPYAPGTIVTLTATPNPGSTFTGWFGDCSGAGDCVLSMNSDKFVVAQFDLAAADAGTGACGAQQVAGGDAADTRGIEMGRTSGTFDFSYDTYTIQDDIVVSYQGQTLFDTGCVGASGSTTLSYGPGSSTQITVTVNPNCAGGTSGTAWDYTIGCPK